MQMHQEIQDLRKALQEKEAHILSLESALANCERTHSHEHSQVLSQVHNNSQASSQASSQPLIQAKSGECHSIIVPPNPYLKQEIPHFIKVYSLAPSNLDNLLDWNMFSLPQLEYFLGMLNRLWRDDLEEIVSRFESHRMTLQSMINETS